MAKSIPIYDGDPFITDFINGEAFIQFNDQTVSRVEAVINNEELYDSIISQPKTKELDYSSINDNFDRLLQTYNC